ncbi:MAG: TIGR03915 family putative DNA repair protein [Kiritimatiellia bacterium]
MEVQFDGTPDGCLCAVAWALQHSGEISISAREDSNGTADLFANQTPFIPTESEQADALFRQLQHAGGKEAARNVLRSLMVMPPGQANALLKYTRLVLKHGSAVDRLHADPDVAFIHKSARKVSHEIHRFKGLLRFSKLRDERFMAIYEPDYDITLFLSWHFARRLRAQHWIILDAKRQCAATWNGNVINAETPDRTMLTGTALQMLLRACDPDPSDVDVQEKWRIFHQSIAIENRVNPALQRRCMPARYWKHLTEMEPSVG